LTSFKLELFSNFVERGITVDRFHLGDVVQLRKKHPCGSDRWEILRTGMDFRIRCQGCGHQVLISRPKFEKSVKKIISQPREGSDE